MSDPLHSSKYSIEHAKRRIAEFEGEVGAFFKTDPYTRVVEHNADGTEDFYKIKLVKPMPIPLPGIAFDAINSLRSALDQAGFATAVATNRKGNNAKFPFAGDATDMQANVTGYSNGKGRSKEIPKEIFDLMATCQPYKGGCDLLWAVNQLANSHKHEIVIPVAIHTGGVSMDVAHMECGSFSFPPKWDRSKNEMVVARLRHGTQYHFDLKIATYIALAKVDVVDGKPAIGTMKKFADMVDGIIVAIEAEARRIELFP